MAAAAGQAPADQLTRFPAPAGAGRRAAVLLLFGERAGSDGAAGPAGRADLLVIERASTLRAHAGQPAFPGGAADPGDGGPAGTALREAAEEVGLEPDSVQVAAVLPALWLPVSDFAVTPVLAWWRRPHPVGPRDPAEVAAVHRIGLVELVDPANRCQVRHPSGYVGPAFEVRGLLIWGFTAGLIDRLLALGGLDRAWDQRRIRALPPEDLELAVRTRPADAPSDVP